MTKNWFLATDERMTSMSRKIAVIVLGLTQAGLLVAVLYRRFVLDMPPEQYSDIRLILLLSVFGYIVARVYYGAVLLVLPVRALFGIYVGLVVLLLVLLSLWVGLPDLQNWQNTILPVIAGPAILVIAYGLLAHFSQKRIEKEIDEHEEAN
jgi:hypothetical protein